MSSARLKLRVPYQRISLKGPSKILNNFNRLSSVDEIFMISRN